MQSIGNELKYTYVLNIVDKTEASSLRTDVASSPVVALTSENPNPLVSEFLVRSEEEGNLASTRSNVASRDVGVLSDVARKLLHEGLAETTDFRVRLALRVEVRATLSTSHIQAGERILESLFETEEFEDGEVYGWVETKAALVGTKCRVVLLIGGEFSDRYNGNDRTINVPGHGTRGLRVAFLGHLPKQYGTV